MAHAVYCVKQASLNCATATCASPRHALPICSWVTTLHPELVVDTRGVLLDERSVIGGDVSVVAVLLQHVDFGFDLFFLILRRRHTHRRKINPQQISISQQQIAQLTSEQPSMKMTFVALQSSILTLLADNVTQKSRKLAGFPCERSSRWSFSATFFCRWKRPSRLYWVPLWLWREMVSWWFLHFRLSVFVILFSEMSQCRDRGVWLNSLLPPYCVESNWRTANISGL